MVDVAERERRLGARDVQDDQVVDRLRVRRTRPGRPRSGPRPARRVRASFWSPQSPSLAIAGPTPSLVPGRTRLGGGRKFVAAGRRSGRRRRRPEFRRNSSADSANEPCADVVAADDELGRRRQVEALEHRQLGHQARRRHQAVAMAAKPSVIVVPTPPKAPTNQRPTRRCVMSGTTCWFRRREADPNLVAG